MISSSTKKVGLVSWPVGHSMSPVMHNAAFENLGLDWVYLPLPVAPENLADGIAGLRAMNFVGCNVSVPHKTHVITYMDELDAAAKQMQAVNTIKNVDGRLLGSNTDPVGFTRQLTSDGLNPDGMNILMIGAGGAARAAVFGLAEYKVNSITVFDVVESQAGALVSNLSYLFKPGRLNYQVIDDQHFADLGNTPDLVINASPIGMAPEVDASPWPENVDLPKNAIFFDIVYNPPETRFLSRAKAEGHKTLSGLGMLVYQGAVSFETWTNIKPPIEVMYRAAKDALGHSLEKN